MKRIYKIGTVILVVVCLLTFLTVPVSAVTGTNYTFPFQKPTVTDFSCYVEVLTTSGNAYVVFVFDDPVRASDTYVQHVPYFQLTSDSSSIRILAVHDDYSDTLHGLLVRSSGSFSVLGSSVSSITFSPGETIAGIHYYGNIENLTPQSFSSQPPFTFSYAAEGVGISFLDSISTYLRYISQDVSNYLPNMAQDTSQMLDYLTSIFESNEEFYQELIDYFNDDKWSLFSDLSNDLYDLKSYIVGTSSSPGLLGYLSSIGQDISDSKSYLESLQDLEQNTHVQAPTSDSYNPDFDSTSPPRDDSTIQDIADAEQDALGGMTQEEVKEQVDETFDTESKIEEVGGEEINVENITIVNNLFGDMFSVFGGAWSTFFILNLTIAFAAFLIGRKY